MAKNTTHCIHLFIEFLCLFLVLSAVCLYICVSTKLCQFCLLVWCISLKMFRDINCSWLVTLVADWCWSVKWPGSAMISKDLEH